MYLSIFNTNGLLVHITYKEKLSDYFIELKRRKNMKKDRLNVFFMAAIAILAVGAVSAFGFGWFNPNGSNGENSTDMQAFHQEVQTAIQNDDYATWKSLMESQLTEENFQNIVR